MATVGERIRQVREARGWTQERLANEAKISKGFLSELEKHDKNVSLELLGKVATALGASVGYLASGEGAQPGKESRLSFRLNSLKLRRSYAFLTPKPWTSLRHTVRSLLAVATA